MKIFFSPLYSTILHYIVGKKNIVFIDMRIFGTGSHEYINLICINSNINGSCVLESKKDS